MNFDFLDRMFRGSKLSRRQLAQAKPRAPGILVNWHNLRGDNLTDDEIAQQIKSVPTHHADGIYYVDRRLPHLIADQSAVTPTTTQKSVWAVGASNPCILPANYWTLGKTLRLTANLKLTTGTAGNSTFAMAYGAADAPACVVSSATRAKIASVGPFGMFMQGYATCRSIGTAGTLSMWGITQPDLGVFLSTSSPFVFPSTGVTVVSTMDTTVGTNGLMFEYMTSAGTDSILATDIILESMN